MRQPSERQTHIALTLLSGLGVFAFWRFGHPEALSCAEELQLFLFNADYLAERLAFPGGLAAYAGEFVTQFFSLLTLGAALQAALLVALQRLTWLAMRRAEGLYALSFAPAAALLVMMGDECILPGYEVMLIAGMAACVGVSRIADRGAARWAALALGLPALFYVAGSGAYVMAAYATGMAVGRKRFTESACVAAYMVVIVVAGYRLSAFPLDLVAKGLGAYRLHIVPASLAIGACIMGLMPLVRPRVGLRHGLAFTAGAFAILCAAAAIGTRITFDEFKYRVMRYDLLTRKRDWKGVLDLAKKHEAQSPLELASINFALAMRGELGERMFEYAQINSEGLIPLFSREVFTTMMTTDIYFGLGMLNTSRRFAFEAQESIPNKQKSGRLTKRLAEVAIIDGHYGIARRYLNVLSQSFAYSKWADEMTELIKDDTKVSSHPLYGKMRKRRLTKDFFYSDREMDQMLGLLFTRDTGNRLALDYLLACELLTRDLGGFVRYIPLMGQLPDGGRGRIAKAYQEALCLAWAQNHKSFDGMPWPVDASVKRSFIDFAHSQSAKRTAPQVGNERLKTTYWSFYVKAK